MVLPKKLIFLCNILKINFVFTCDYNIGYRPIPTNNTEAGNIPALFYRAKFLPRRNFIARLVKVH
jgi:hypothetical protein